MARHLSVASAIDKNKITSGAVWVALLEIRIIDPNSRAVTETLYIARNDESLLFQGQLYQAANFEFQIDQKQGEDPSVSVTAQDQTRYIASRMENMAGGVFSELTLRIVNSERLDHPPEMEHVLQVTASSVKNYVVSFTLGAENPLTVSFPRHRQFKGRCVWRFKGYGCGYTGPVATCDYTLEGANGCVQKNNQLNFRGLPGLVRLNI
jgi:hypothetical protein